MVNKVYRFWNSILNLELLIKETVPVIQRRREQTSNCLMNNIIYMFAKTWGCFPVREERFKSDLDF